MGVVANPEVEVDQSTPQLETQAPLEVEEVTPPIEDGGDAIQTEADEDVPPSEEPAPEPPPKTYTEAELREQSEARARQIAEEQRRQQQAAADRRAHLQQLEENERQERKELLQAALDRGDDPQAVLERYDQKRQNQWLDRAEGISLQALTALAEQIEGKQPYIGDPRVQRVFEQLEPAMNLAFQAGVQAAQGQQAAEYIPKTDLDKYVDAEIKRRNAKAREGKTPVKRPEGTPVVSNVMSWEAYQSLSDADKIAMPDATRREIMAADAAKRRGG